MIEVELCSAAEDDYANAINWYSERSIEVAERFDAELNAALKTIAEAPERFPRCDNRHRYFLMRNFPYQIIYRKQHSHWTVIAIAHSARNPDWWANR